MADVVLYVALLAAVPCLYLIGFYAGRQSVKEQERRDRHSMRKYATFQGKSISKDEFEGLF